MWDTAIKYLEEWAMEITPELIRVERPHEEKAGPGAETIYKACGDKDEEDTLELRSPDTGVILCYNTRTGVEVLVPADSVIPEPSDHPTYILRLIGIEGFEVLVFFYCRASINLVQGDIAEKEGFLVVTWSPGKLRVGGGLKLDTVYGIYKVSLGPSADGEFFEITCRGLPVLTEKFSEHSLKDLNKEVYPMGILPRDVPLPKVLGGDAVGLLMGITSTRTDPVLIHTLPCGLGIYRALFRDPYGSDIAYCSPHHIFYGKGASNHGVKSYQQILGELYWVRGELINKAMCPEPLILKPDCTLEVQAPMAYPGGGDHVPVPLPAGRRNARQHCPYQRSSGGRPTVDSNPVLEGIRKAH